MGNGRGEGLRVKAGADFVGAEAVAADYALDAQLVGCGDFPHLVGHTVNAALIEQGRLDEEAAPLNCAPAIPVCKALFDGRVYDLVEAPQFVSVGKDCGRDGLTVYRAVGSDGVGGDFVCETLFDMWVIVHQRLGLGVAVKDIIRHCAKHAADDRFAGADASADRRKRRSVAFRR